MNTRTFLAAWSFGVVALLAGGCQCCAPSASPSAIAQADAQRADLAKFVGAWEFTGSWTGENGASNQVAGRAAGVLENQYFVLLDIQTTSGTMAGRTGRKAGSMLLAAEPGIGLTLTAWGDASPSVMHLVGRDEDAGSTLTFRSAHGEVPLTLVIRVENADRWTASINNTSTNTTTANYTFTRSK
ncbi:MAG: hypothetical protein U0573_01150 [Phycisphaerales bacterium]|nr:hypothetical protein [Planctomycetota bacterium]